MFLTASNRADPSCVMMFYVKLQFPRPQINLQTVMFLLHYVTCTVVTAVFWRYYNLVQYLYSYNISYHIWALSWSMSLLASRDTLHVARIKEMVISSKHRNFAPIIIHKVKWWNSPDWQLYWGDSTGVKRGVRRSHEESGSTKVVTDGATHTELQNRSSGILLVASQRVHLSLKFKDYKQNTKI